MKRRKQFAALPYRRAEEGRQEILLVTSRETGRWVLPKGWPMKKHRPHRAAAIEAYEEAGVKGEPAKSAIGTYDYDKRLENGAVPCRVRVYPLLVEALLADWPEKAERQRAWFAPDEAAERVEEPELQALLRRFEARMPKKSAAKTADGKHGEKQGADKRLQAEHA